MDDKAETYASVSHYDSLIAAARNHIRQRQFDAAQAHLSQAVHSQDGRPEAYNLLGVLEYVHGDRLSAQKQWRLALAHDATYEPAHHNLTRSVRGPLFRGPLDLGD